MGWYDNNKTVPFDTLKGKTITKIEGLFRDSDVAHFYTSDGKHYKMFHDQECCESVEIEDVVGDVEDLIGNEVLIAEERTSENENPAGVVAPEYQDSFTWTFYTIATRKGYVDIRWYGESNGFYSESVTFEEVVEE